jgi:hypothetical protein
LNRGVRRLVLALAAAPCAYAAFVYGWELVSFGGFAVRLDENLPGSAWAQIGLVAAQTVIIAAALTVVWQGAEQERYRKAVVALALAWLASAPLWLMLLRPPF